MIRASIDLGTNTCLVLIAEWNSAENQVTQVHYDHCEIVRLGEGVDQEGKLLPEPQARTLECLRNYKKQVEHWGVSPEDVICVATSQARDASNGEAFFESVQNETGFFFKTLSGQEEAQATFIGAMVPPLVSRDSVVIDIGGGSTEFMSEYAGQSFDMGGVRFTERYLRSDPVTESEFLECQKAIDQQVEILGKSFSRKKLVAVAGTPTTLAQWALGIDEFQPEKIDGQVLTVSQLAQQVEELRKRTIKERTTLPGVSPKRADILLAGAMILWRACVVLGFSQCVVSTRGLRYGVLHSSV